MQFIYDNLTASIIAATTTLLIFSLQSQATQSNMARTARNMTKQQAQSFASWLERDLGRVGANISQDERVPFDEPETSQMEGGVHLTEQFTFYRDESDGDGNETRIATRYHVEKVKDEPKDLYQLTRKTKEEGAGSWSGADENGMSSPTLGYFQIDMLDKNAELVPSPKSSFDEVQTIRVRFSVVPSFENEETVLSATHVGSFTLVRQDNGGFGTPGESGDDCNGEDRDRGHGNDCDGFDEDNPGQSEGTG